MQDKQIEQKFNSIEHSKNDVGVGKLTNFEESQQYNQYKEFFSQFLQDRLNHHRLSPNALQELSKSKIKYNILSFSPFNVNIISSSSNNQVANIELEWGYYTLSATLIKNIGESIFHKCKSQHGSLARVYKVEDQEDPFVVKCISTKTQQFEDKINMQKCALQEYFIFRIASALSCGPYMKNHFGFDIQCSQDCIQFAMEHCSQIKSISQKVVDGLKESLFTLHQARIVHFDIKPNNLMWSNHFKKEVFIDFGLSQIFDGSPGFKYYVKFKGSLNYCSQQMSSLFASQNQQLLDVYYNDISCLKETIMTFQSYFFLSTQGKNQNIFQYSKYTINYTEQIIDIKEFSIVGKIYFEFKLKIMLLKYFIYVKDKQMIDQIYQNTAQKNLLFSGQILDFVKGIYQAIHLKEFYQRYITDPIKDSVQYGWINIWAKSLYSKMTKVQLENIEQKTVFVSLSESLTALSRLSSKSIDTFNRSEIEKIIFTKNLQDLEVYFYCFLSYISFINNYHQVNIYQKSMAFEIFIQNLLPQFAKSRLKSKDRYQYQNLISILKQVCRFILSYYTCKQYELKETKLDSFKKLQLILDVVQHVFFFALFSTEETVELLNKIYYLKLWSQQQRMEIIIRVNMDNDWNLIPLFAEVSISNLAIQYWIDQITSQFKKQKLNPQVYIIFCIFEFKDNRDDYYLLDYQPFNSFPTSFKIRYWLSKLVFELVDKRSFIIVNIMKFIEDHFPQSQKRRLYSIYFHIFSIFIIIYSNRQECMWICQMFKNHLKSEQLYDRLIFLRILKMQRSIEAKQKILALSQIVKVIKLENTGFLMSLLSTQLKNILDLTNHIPNKEFFSQFGVSQLVQNLEQVNKKITFRMSPEKIIKKCQRQKHVYFYFTLRFTIYFLLRLPYSNLSNQLDQLRIIIENKKCQLCRLNMYYYYFQLKIEESIYVSPQNVVQGLINICTAYDQFENSIGEQQISSQLIYEDRVFKTYNSITNKLIFLNCVDGRLHKILYKTYRFCKEKSRIERYFQCMYIPRITHYALEAISQFGGFEQMKEFLRDIFYYIRYTENTSSLRTVCSDFRTLLENHLIKSKPKLLIQIMSFLQKQEKKQPYVASFYYAYVLSTSNNSDRFKFIIKIFNLIQFIPLKIASYLQSSLYCFLLYKDHALLKAIIAMNKNSKAQQLQTNPRRVNKMERMLIRSVHNVVHVTQNRKRFWKNQTKVKKTLLEKCQNLGSYILPEYSNKNLHLKPLFL